MFLSPGEQVSVENLLKGIVTLSGNDAAVVLSECIAGTEQAFTDQMNALAKKLGATNSHFGTANGWPDNGVTYVTARDLATIARATIEHHPEALQGVLRPSELLLGQDDGRQCASPRTTATRLLGRVQGRMGSRPAIPKRQAMASPARPSRTAAG